MDFAQQQDARDDRAEAWEQSDPRFWNFGAVWEAVLCYARREQFRRDMELWNTLEKQRRAGRYGYYTLDELEGLL